MAHFLVTGGAGFIGSNLVRGILAQGDRVRVLDNFSTGDRANLADLASDIDIQEGDICNRSQVDRAMAGIDYCLHQAAIPSVPRSVLDPAASNEANVGGSINVFLAAREAGVKRLIFASSSSVYGNAATMPLCESLPRAPISPYGVSKAAMEMYAETFNTLYDLELVALRYFNVFGPRQDPQSPYAAVIPIFLSHIQRAEKPPVHGDGLQARDFTFVENVVRANLGACAYKGALRGVFNIACGDSITILDLLDNLNHLLDTNVAPAFAPAREGDIRQSWADIRKAQEGFAYHPAISFQDGLKQTIDWFRAQAE